MENLEKEYLRQQTPEGQTELKVREKLLRAFREVNGITPLNIGEICPLHDAKTKTVRYIKL